MARGKITGVKPQRPDPTCDRGREPHVRPHLVLVRAEGVESGAAESVGESGLSGSRKTIYELLNAGEPRPMDDIVETRGLNSSVVLATLVDLEMKGMVRQIPGNQFSKVLL